MTSLNLIPSQDSYYTDNYIDYERQNPPHKIRFYMNLVKQWVGESERIFELGVEFGFLQVIKDPVYLGTTMPAVIGDKPAEYYSPKTIDPVLGLGITVYDRI